MLIEIIFAFAFTFFFFLHEKFRIEDEQTQDASLSDQLKVQWHKYKGGIQITVFSYVGYAAYFKHSNFLYWFGISLFCASFFWMFQDGLLNCFLFKKSWWFTGTTATIDKKFGSKTIEYAKIISLLTAIGFLTIWKIFY